MILSILIKNLFEEKLQINREFVKSYSFLSFLDKYFLFFFKKSTIFCYLLSAIGVGFKKHQNFGCFEPFSFVFKKSI